MPFKDRAAKLAWKKKRRCDNCGLTIESSKGYDVEIFVGNKFKLSPPKAMLCGDICSDCVDDFVAKFESNGMVLQADTEKGRERGLK